MFDLRPTYVPAIFERRKLSTFINEVTWVSETAARLESFMAADLMEYTYGKGINARTYKSGPYHSEVLDIQNILNGNGNDLDYNVCFLNRYDNSSMALGWHADDSPGMDHNHPIAVISFGQEREIWVRPNGFKGVIPPENRFMLGHGSFFEMPAHFQEFYQHRIPKGDRAMSTRISLTFRHYAP